MELTLDGRVALITGGSLGLGRAMAETFCAAGAAVAIVARRADALETTRAEIERNTGGRVRAYVCDVSDPAQIIATHRNAVADLGPIDILVNNAGKSAAHPFEVISDEIWQADLDLKLFAAVRLTRLVWPNMKAQRWGRVINLLNTHAKTPAANTAPTSVTRAAGMALTKVLAGEGAPHNILVNALLIGRIVSDQIRRAHAASDGGVSLEDFIAQAGTRLPMGRMGEASECANVALFLASEASSYLTGCAINMDGGLSPVV